jgi:hypothetical protein
MNFHNTRTAVIFLTVLSTAAGGQQRDTTRRAADTTTTRPFVRGGVFDKPYLTRLAGRAAIGGYAEAHARYQRVDGQRDDTGFEAKRFNLFANALVSDWVRLGAELEFEDGAEEILLEYAAIDVRIHPSFLTLRGGMLLSPLGRFNLAHDSPLNEFTDRPLVSTELIGVALSEPGFGVLGHFPVGGEGRVTYELYSTNGFHDGLITNSENGTRIPRGRRNLEDNNGSPAFVGRVAWSPRIGFELGASAHRGAYNVFNNEGAQVDKRRDLTIGVIDAEATLLGTRLSGEGAVAAIDVPESLRGIYATAQRGFYVEAMREVGHGLIRTMPQSSFGVKVRWDYMDFDTGVVGTSTAQLSAGVNFRPTMDSVLKLDFVRGRARDEFNNRGEHAYVLFSLATYF